MSATDQRSVVNAREPNPADSLIWDDDRSRANIYPAHGPLGWSYNADLRLSRFAGTMWGSVKPFETREHALAHALERVIRFAETFDRDYEPDANRAQARRMICWANDELAHVELGRREELPWQCVMDF